MAPAMFFYADCDDRQLLSSKSPCRKSCFLCNKPLRKNADIFMYRGNTPFCSTECRQEQIEMDDVEERRRRKQSAALRNNMESARSSTGNKSIREESIRVA